jgi:hypothetical protein
MIVMNTLTGAVSEYTGFGFQSITATHAGSATGLWQFGGDTDDGLPIVARLQTGKTSLEEHSRKVLDATFLGLEGSGSFRYHVHGEAGSWAYDFTAHPKGESRTMPGRGINETYLSFGFSNPVGQWFRIDRIEQLMAQSASRRA